MGSITKRTSKDGKIRFKATVRVDRTGYPAFSKSKTFSKKSLAEEWIRRLESEIELNPDKVLKQQPKSKTLKECIQQYLNEIDGFAETKVSSLKHLCTFDIAEQDIQQLSRQDFSAYALLRRHGDESLQLEAVAPATILKDLSHLKAVLTHAENIWGLDIEHVLVEYEKALIALRKSRIVTRSKTRTRLPTKEELQKLTNYFYKSWKRVSTSAPMHLIMWLAIYTARRQDELCNLHLSDFDKINQQWLIRDIKNPNGSDGNHRYAHLEPNALLVIEELMKPDIRKRMARLGLDMQLLIPVKAQTVSSFFTRACQYCNIEDLCFHDLRHESATRYAEDGLTIPQLQTITLHESWNSLKRYVNLKKRGERLDYLEAIMEAENNYNEHYKNWSKKQYYIALVDKLEELEQEQEINTNYLFLNSTIERFIRIYQNNKYFKRLHTKQNFNKNPFAWNHEEFCFYADDIQLAWKDWLIDNIYIDWSELPKDCTHLNIVNFSIIKKTQDRILVWDKIESCWIDSFNMYLFVEQEHKQKPV